MNRKITKSFNLFVGWENGEIHIFEENGSGCVYDCLTIKDAKRCLGRYIEYIQEREVD